MQNALWGQDPMRLTQGENTSGRDASHQLSLALDAGGANTGAAGSVDKFYAPWDGKVVRADGSSNNAMFIESSNAVQAPNGTVAVQRLVLIHTNHYLLRVGQTFKQGDHIYTEGTKGGVSSHIHIEGGFGTWASVGGAKLVRNSANTWVIQKQAHIYDMLFVPDNYTISNGKGYAWKRASAAAATPTTPATEEDMKLKIFAPMDIVPSSQLMKEGNIYVGGKMFNPNGDARMVKQFDENISEVFADMLGEIQPGEIMMAQED